ncbi:DUF4192 family protein [Streptomyces sp. NPDC059785]|uniref:DUF4192 domain-containing protein n=1 Tax=unclassified Streptomyces TaxID=2593676 RepID=UPI00365630E0
MGHGHGVLANAGADQQVTLRTPAELADALPYLLGYRPEDSIVLVAVHEKERQGRFGGRARLGIPARTDDWPAAAEQLARGLITGSERRGGRPESMIVYLCQEPRSGETGRDVMARLRPLAHLMRTRCGDLDVAVVEALCISDGRYWSYCCPSEQCCCPEGEPMGLPGTSVLAAAATYAGLQIRGSLREFRARLSPWETAAALEQQAVLDAANRAIVPRILDAAHRAEVAETALDLARTVIRRFTDARPAQGPLEADLRDDELLAHDEAAALILALQDRTTRDRAAQWMEGDEAGPALRLWRALARRCVGVYGEHAAAPLTLAGWVAWSSGDEIEAREALAMALGADPDYLFARLLHQACNEGIDPESIRRCLRAERHVRVGPETTASAPAEPACSPDTALSPPSLDTAPHLCSPDTASTPFSDAVSNPPSSDTAASNPSPPDAGPGLAARESSCAGPSPRPAPPSTTVRRRHRRARTADGAGTRPARRADSSEPASPGGAVRGRSQTPRRATQPGTGRRRESGRPNEEA